jgi:hypothetical protein
VLCVRETLVAHPSAMDNNNLISLLIHHQSSVDHHTQLELEERGRFSQSRRDVENHEIELQAQLAEKALSI